MTRFHLVRHGAHDLLGHTLVGRGPVSISAMGQAQTAAVGRGLAEAGCTALVSSPSGRALQTAEIIAAAIALPVRVEPELDEIDMGEWTGASFAALHADARWQAFNSFRSTAPVPGGEAMLAVQHRAVTTLMRLRHDYPDGLVVLVSHADVIKAILLHFLAMPLDLMRRIDVEPSSRSVVDVYDHDAVVRGINIPPPAMPR